MDALIKRMDHTERARRENEAPLLQEAYAQKVKVVPSPFTATVCAQSLCGAGFLAAMGAFSCLQCLGNIVLAKTLLASALLASAVLANTVLASIVLVSAVAVLRAVQILGLGACK